MKLITFCALIGLTFAQDVTPRRDSDWPPPEVLLATKPAHDGCVSKTGVSEQMLKEFEDGRSIENEKLKCYMQCIFTETNVVDETGNIHLEKLAVSFLEKVPHSMHSTMLKMGQKCLMPKGENLCEKAFWIHSCWRKSDPKHYFLL